MIDPATATSGGLNTSLVDIETTEDIASFDDGTSPWTVEGPAIGGYTVTDVAQEGAREIRLTVTGLGAGGGFPPSSVFYGGSQIQNATGDALDPGPISIV